nr:PQQ-dependent sugar dehydrogenase [Candidatus Palauibacterales bacterium]
MRLDAPRLTAAALLVLASGLIACSSPAQQTGDLFPNDIEAEQGVITVNVVEFASIPDVDGEPARMMTMVHEEDTGRLFISDQRGPIYIVSEDGESVTEYIDVDAGEWGVDVDAGWREKGVQNFAFHPQFGEEGTPGYGKFYVWTDTPNKRPEPDFVPGAGEDSHDMVLVEFTAENPEADSYDGGQPRVLARFEQPYGNHNGGELTFNPLAEPGDADYGMLYVGVGDGGAGGDPHDLAQDLSSGFGKILRIDPLGSNGPNGEYGIPDDNPFAGDDDPETLGEIWAWGLRNPQHLAWDPATGQAYVADIGQNTVEEVSPISAGADLGWNDWEGSFEFVDGGVIVDSRRSDPDATYPIAEYDHSDPVLVSRQAVTGLEVYRDGSVSALRGRILFGDLAAGEIFHVSADDVPEGGQDPIRRVLLDDGSGEPKTLLQLVQEKNEAQGRDPAGRVDLRMAMGPEGRVFLLNKHDGT